MKTITLLVSVSLLAACVTDDEPAEPDDFSGGGGKEDSGFAGEIKELGRYEDERLDLGQQKGEQHFAGKRAGGKRYLGVQMELAPGRHDFQIENDLGTGVKAFLLDKSFVLVDWDYDQKQSIRLRAEIRALGSYWLVVRDYVDGPGDFMLAHGGDVDGVHHPLPPDCTLTVTPSTVRVGAQLSFTIKTVGETTACSAIDDPRVGLPRPVTCNATWRAPAVAAGTFNFLGKVVGPKGHAGLCKAVVTIKP